VCNIVEVSEASGLLDGVHALWRANSDNLGYMPRGGFDQAARQRTLLAALRNDALLGYVLFRNTRDRISITHLCVDPCFRGQGVARALFDAVRTRAIASVCYDITLRCRRDFSARQLWPRLGFVPIKDIPGRALGTTLTIWRCELEELPLLRRMAPPPSAAVAVVIDANIFLDLDETSPGSDESAGLQSDWLTEFVELRITDELLNEINRREDPEDRERQRLRVARFPKACTDSQREQLVLPRVEILLGGGSSPSAESDARQVAKTVAAGVSFFVTRDSNIIASADGLYHEFGLRVLEPHELILQFDELRREEEYRPQRLAFGTNTMAGPPRAEQLEALAALLHNGQPSPEPRKQTRSRLRELMATPDAHAGTCITHNGQVLAAYFVARPAAEELCVPFFAVTAEALGATAARHYVNHLVHVAAHEGRQVIRLRGPAGRVEEALQSAGFFREQDEWIKIALHEVGDAPTVESRLHGLADRCPAAAALAGRITTSLHESGLTPEGLARVERALWPAKIHGTGLPCFIIPIRAKWAKELFDEELARGTLFGAEPALAMNSENVYYRAPTPLLPIAPSRVLWYVSQDNKYHGTMAIRACSYVEEMAVGRPKDIYRRFKRLGVYEWRNVFDVARKDLGRNVLAFRFSMTEPFRRPIGWGESQRLLTAHQGRGSQFQGPLQISEACFLEIYSLGTQRNGDAA
jgi:GNAT superfamily N-acetyltransferase